MRTDLFLAQAKQNLKEATWRQMALLISLALNLLLALAAWKREIVINLPPAASSEAMVIAERSANQETKIAHGLYLAGLLGNVAPNNAAFIEQSVGRFVTPRAFKTYLGAIQQQVSKIRDEQLSTNFQATEATYDPESDQVSVSGLLTTRGVTEIEQRDYRTFLFRFVTRDHQTLLDELQIVDEQTRLAAAPNA